MEWVVVSRKKHRRWMVEMDANTNRYIANEWGESMEGKPIRLERGLEYVLIDCKEHACLEVAVAIKTRDDRHEVAEVGELGEDCLALGRSLWRLRAHLDIEHRAGGG